jgi:hypothetical protein
VAIRIGLPTSMQIVVAISLSAAISAAAAFFSQAMR